MARYMLIAAPLSQVQERSNKETIQIKGAAIEVHKHIIKQSPILSINRFI